MLFQVGPKQKDYKVKDRKEYEFKPEQIVSDIAHIYVYLSKNDTFCRAILGEARSFSHQLFAQAVVVLQKIGVSPDFVVKFEEVSTKLQVLIPMLSSTYVSFEEKPIIDIKNISFKTHED